MEKKKAKRRSGMAANVIGAIVLLLAILGLIVSALGYVSFTRAFKQEYAVSTYHMARTATALINGDHLDAYMAGGEPVEYQRTRHNLDVYCQKMHVSLIYLIQVDQSDYGRFISIFNAVNNEVDDTSYTPWELGHRRDTTNDEYRQKYKALYEQTSEYETVYRIKTTDGQHPHITTLVPVTNSAGETVAILCMQRPVSELREAQLPYLRSVAFSTVLLALIASALAVFFIHNQVIEPIRKVSDEASRFARENTRGEGLGEISRYRELSELAGSIDTMETDMVSYIENLTAVTAEKERIGTELELGTRIQAAMLPSVFPAFPGRADFDVYASMDPAREIGGDFYDFFLVDEDHLCLVMADVSGKGVPAALFMMASKIILQSCAMLGSSASEILTKTNEAICSNNQAEMFVTVWVGILELSTGRLTAANAGHEYPAVKRAKGGFELFRDKHGLVVGAMEGLRYKDYELRLEPGDKLFLYTDGVPEATDADMGMFGTARMLEALNAAADGTPQQILRSVRLAVDGFVRDAEQFDDLTMLCLEYRGKEAKDHDD